MITSICSKNLTSDSPGLVDFAARLVDFFHLSDGKVKVSGEFFF